MKWKCIQTKNNTSLFSFYLFFKQFNLIDTIIVMQYIYKFICKYNIFFIVNCGNIVAFDNLLFLCLASF